METQTQLKLSIQSALLGEVTNDLVAVTACLKDQHIVLRFYYDKAIESDEIERAGAIGGEVIADFSAEYTIEEEVRQCTSRSDIEVLDFFAFLRELN